MQEPASNGRSSQQQPARPRVGRKTPQEISPAYQPGKAPPLRVLEVLIKLFNTSTRRWRKPSHKTRQERAQFLRRFFRDLKQKAGFKRCRTRATSGRSTSHAMVQVWQQAHLAPATIQTYLSFLRGLAMWMGKHGFVRKPGHYGLSLEEYQRHESAQRDKSWTAQGSMPRR